MSKIASGFTGDPDGPPPTSSRFSSENPTLVCLHKPVEGLCDHDTKPPDMATVTCSECGNESEYDDSDATDRVPCTHCENMIQV